MKALDKILFQKINWWLLLLLPLVAFGFFPTYFGKLFQNLPSIFHIHAFFMLLWIGMAIVQPYLIKKKKTKIHKRIGKLSYFLMPVVLFTAWLMIRHSYFKFMADETIRMAKEGASLTAPQMTIHAAEYMRIGVLYWFWLGLFYVLAVINKRKMVFHATYMFAAILTLLGPTVDRFLYHVYGWMHMNPDPFIATFILIDLLLAALLFYQRRHGVDVKATAVTIMIYLAGQVIFYLLPKMMLWKFLIDPI